MDNATIARGSTAREALGAARPATRCMPLAFLRGGESAVIAKVRGSGELHHHLENLGFVAGAQVKVVSESAGDLIVEVKGAQVAIDRHVAARIMANASA
ncbi:FeoA family protein [Arabiibacter massiliensis]|uniref:FeoA family protein n=1 Tax=Arabiibacter massiliensis TaxID=1870985 RepID=UPI001E60A196|nr:FeoA family protein [Arabiibacter massiliensis]